MAYEKRYKERVLEYISEGHTQREAAEVFKISTYTIWKWKNTLLQTGCLDTRKRNRPAKKLPGEKLIAYVDRHPDAYLSEIAEHFGCTGEAVHKALKRLNITRKKRR
jgi:transposase